MAIYIEHWEVMDNPYGNRIDFAYSDEQREQGMVGFMRDEHFEENGVGALVRLLSVDRIKEERKENKQMYKYDNYTDSFIRIDGEPNTGTTTVRVGVPLKESAIVQKTELTDECIDRIADAVVRKLADRKTENSSEKPNNSND